MRFIDTFVYRGGDALAAASVDQVLGPLLLVGMAPLRRVGAPGPRARPSQADALSAR